MALITPASGFIADLNYCAGTSQSIYVLLSVHSRQAAESLKGCFRLRHGLARSSPGSVQSWQRDVYVISPIALYQCI